MKSHGVYETPGGTILYKAHEAWNSSAWTTRLCTTKNSRRKYAELVYNGQWFTPLHEAMHAFVQTTEKNITGTVRFKLYKGNAILVGRNSPYSLYREDYVTFDEEDVYNQQDAEGFIKLFGLPLKVQAMLEIEGRGVSRYRITDYSSFKHD